MKRFLKLLNLKKKLNEEDYPQSSTTPKIISSILIDEFKAKIVNFTDIFNAGVIFRMLHQNDLDLSEGDVINIETSENLIPNQFDFFDWIDSLKSEKDRKIKDIMNKEFRNRFKDFSYNFTFLIELNPL